MDSNRQTNKRSRPGINYEYLPGETVDERKRRIANERRKLWRDEQGGKVRQQDREYARKRRADALASNEEETRAKEREAAKLHRERYPEKSREVSREYAREHREANISRAAEWNKNNGKRRYRNNRRIRVLDRVARGLPVYDNNDTEIKQRVFIETFKGCGNITVACEAAGVTRQAVIVWRATSDDFDKAYEEARLQSIEILEAVARQRAMAGSDRLLIFLLRSLKPETYGQKVEPQVYLRAEAEKLSAEFGVPFEQVYNELIARASERSSGRPQQLIGPGRGRAAESTG